MLPPSSQKKSSQKRDFDLGLCASHHPKNNPPKGRIHKRWDKNLVQEILPEGRIIDRILLIEGYLHISTFYSEIPWLRQECFGISHQYQHAPPWKNGLLQGSPLHQYCSDHGLHQGLQIPHQL